MSTNLNKNNSTDFAPVPAAIAFVPLQCLILAQALLAYQDRFFDVSQMQGRGVDQGLPFAWHFAMWADLLLISPLAAHLTGRCWYIWRRKWMIVSLAIGMISAATMGWLYTYSGMPEAHLQNHALTKAGYLHLIYMALAIAIFTQFLFFTNPIPVPLLRIVSALLFLHILVGTHMLLGVIDILHPLNWYPAQPLKSPFGWTMVGIVGLGLVWRNYLNIPRIKTIGNRLVQGLFFLVATGAAGIDSVNRRFFVPILEAIQSRVAKLLFALFEFSTGQDPQTAKGYLKFLDYICGIVLGTTYLLKKVFSLAMHPVENQMPLFLLGIFAFKYFLSRLSVTQELAIGESLFPPNRVPDDLRSGDRVKITAQVVGFMTLYWCLGLVVNYPIAASTIMIGIACFDFKTRDVINENMRQRFSNKKFAPTRRSADYAVIQSRRKVAEWYLLALPHLCKELGVILGCSAALFIAIYGHLVRTDMTLAADFTLIGTQVVNELITQAWRIARYRRLKIVDRQARSKQPV